MRRFVLGTAGHVDHGKTTLVQALTGVETDRLPEEKRRGITIELGFAPWKLGDDVEVSIIDMPGHRRLVHTMIAGASGIEVVLLVVAADEGVMPQTREHIAACELLGLRRAVVAVTKMDRVGRELAELAGEEAEELLAGRFDAEVVVCSSKTGEGLEDVAAAVRRALAEVAPPAEAPRTRISIDRAFSIKGAGTVVTGTLVEGRIAVGDALRIVGPGRDMPTAARGLHIHDESVKEATAPTRLALNLASVSLDDFHRGDVITDDASLSAEKVVDVELLTVAAPKRGRVLSFYVGTARAPAKLERIIGGPFEAAPDAPDDATPSEQAEIAPHPGYAPGLQRHLARLRLTTALPVVGGDRFVLRGSDLTGTAGAVVGGGRVLDARPPRSRPKQKRQRVLTALRDADASEAMRALVEEASPRTVSREQFASRFAIGRATLERAADKLADRGTLVRTKANGFMDREALNRLADVARTLVEEHHTKAPLDRGLGLETLRQRLSALANEDGAAEAIRLASRARKLPDGTSREAIQIEGDIVRLPSVADRAPQGATADALGAAKQALEAAGLKGVSENGFREATGKVVKETRAVVAKLTREGLAVGAGELWFPSAAVDDLRLRIALHLEKAGKLTIADFKAISGLGRKQTIILLELFDKEGLTRRQADDRAEGPLAIDIRAKNK